MTTNTKVGLGVAFLLTAVISFYAGKEAARSEIRGALRTALSPSPSQSSTPPSVPPSSPAESLSAATWTVSEDRSQMDDSRTVTLSLDAESPISAWPSETHTPTLIIRCKEKDTDLYIVNGTSPNVEYDNTDGATVRLRMDSSAAFSQNWNKSTDGDALFAPSPIPLARRLANARLLTYQFTPFNSNPAITTFRVHGLAAHLAKVAEACGWKL